jgi:hypothetical protein
VVRGGLWGGRGVLCSPGVSSDPRELLGVLSLDDGFVERAVRDAVSLLVVVVAAEEMTAAAVFAVLGGEDVARGIDGCGRRNWRMFVTVSQMPVVEEVLIDAASSSIVVFE